MSAALESEIECERRRLRREKIAADGVRSANKSRWDDRTGERGRRQQKLRQKPKWWKNNGSLKRKQNEEDERGNILLRS